jgi:hypothetical protein
MAYPPPPKWATGSASILEPSDGKKAQGWVPGEQPPASFFNWWQNAAYLCLAGLQTQAQRLWLSSLASALAGAVSTQNAGAATSGLSFNPTSGQWATILGGSNAYVGFLLAPASGGTSVGLVGTTEMLYDGTFIQAIGMTDRAISSSPPDLATVSFTTRLATVRQYTAIAANFGAPNIRVAIAASAGFVARSTDGLAWTEAAASGSLTGALQRALIWDPKRARFFMAASDGNAMVSSDGTSWASVGTHGLLGTAMMSAVYYAPMDALVVCGSGSTRAVKYSLDGGVTWTAAGITISGSGVCEVFDIAGQAVGLRGASASLFVSVDLALWTPIALQGVVAAPTSTVRGTYRFLAMPAYGFGQLAYPNVGGAITLSPQVLL